MSKTATRRRPASPRIADLRLLTEAFTIGDSDPSAPALRVDEEKCVIYGVKVVGRFSKNCHGRAGVTEGSEYTPDALKQAVPLYDNVVVNPNHPASKALAAAERNVTESVGVIRNPRYENDGIHGDLHYYPDDPTARKLVHNVKNKLGGMALSHNAYPGRERVQGGKLIIESIAHVNSVDVVQRGGTTDTLWESQETEPVKTTFQAILESWVAKKSPARKAVAKHLLEMDDAPGLDAPVEAPPADPDEQLLAGFKAAIMAIIDGDGSAKDKAKQIAAYLKAHEDLTGSGEPEEPVEEDDESNEPADKKTPAKESLEAKVRHLEAKDACRTLCETLGFTPTKDQLDTLIEQASDKGRKAVAEAFKAAGGGSTEARSGRDARTGTRGQVKSGGPNAGKPAPVTEAQEPKDAKEFAAMVTG
jgi:hypothetical protein